MVISIRNTECVRCREVVRFSEHRYLPYGYSEEKLRHMSHLEDVTGTQKKRPLLTHLICNLEGVTPAKTDIIHL